MLRLRSDRPRLTGHTAATAFYETSLTLRANIFLWVFLATVVPLTALALGATYYAERSYQREVQREVSTSLSNLGAELDRRLQSEREMILSLSNAPAVRDYLPVLNDARQGIVDPDYQMRSAGLNRFLEELEVILPGTYTLRILDASGNSMLKVTNGHHSDAVYDSLNGIPYAEQEINDPAFNKALKLLTPGEVSFVSLPHNRLVADTVSEHPLYDYIVPLSYQDQVVGMLTVTVEGERVDRIIDHTPRLYKGQLFIAEVNPDNTARNGYLLYDDASSLHMAQVRPLQDRAQQHYGQAVWDAMSSQPFGVVAQPGASDSIYYVELLPYPNLLVSWIIGTRIDNSVITAPFQDIRLGIWLFAGVALITSLLLANIGARKLAHPVCRLAEHLKRYADGDYQQRIEPHGLREISALATSFNYMADTLEHAREERDKAQHMLLQSAKLASIGQMAAGIGHEINNPLNNILSLSKLIDRGLAGGSERVHGDLASLREEALRASDIVKGILNFARQVPPHYAPFEVGTWLENTLALVRQEAKDKGVRLRWECADGQTAEGDRSQLQQALINLLLNAIHASPRGAEVSVMARAVDDRLDIAVRDHGPGIAPEVLDKVFDPFFTTKAVGEGSGLGLSISLGIIERHGGTLHVGNHAEGGVTATIMLPLHHAGSSHPVTAEYSASRSHA